MKTITVIKDDEGTRSIYVRKRRLRDGWPSTCFAIRATTSLTAFGNHFDECRRERSNSGDRKDHVDRRRPRVGGLLELLLVDASRMTNVSTATTHWRGRS